MSKKWHCWQGETYIKIPQTLEITRGLKVAKTEQDIMPSYNTGS